MKRLMFWFDFTVGYMMTNPSKLPFYHRMMWETYGTMYCTQEQWEKYWPAAEADQDV